MNKQVEKIPPAEFARMIDEMAYNCGTNPQAVLRVYATLNGANGLSIDRVKYTQDLSYYDEGKLALAARQVELDTIVTGKTVIQFKYVNNLLLKGTVRKIQKRGNTVFYSVESEDPYSSWPTPIYIDVPAHGVLGIIEV